MTSHREPLDSVPRTIGETPMVQGGPEAVPVYAKPESFDRIEVDLERPRPRQRRPRACRGPAGGLAAAIGEAPDG